MPPTRPKPPTRTRAELVAALRTHPKFTRMSREELEVYFISLLTNVDIEMMVTDLDRDPQVG